MKKLRKIHLISILCYIVLDFGGLLLGVLIGKIFNVWLPWISAVPFAIAPLISAMNRLRALKFIDEIQPENNWERRGKRNFFAVIVVEIIFSICCIMILLSE